MRTCTGLFFVLVCSPLWAQQEGEHKDSIDLALETCLDTNITTYDMIMCMDDAAFAWDKALNEAYQQLMQTLSEDQKQLLKESQRQWIIYRDKEMTFINDLYNEPGISWDYVK